MLMYAPLLFLFNGYWMISNVQIFSDNSEFLWRTYQHMRSNHKAGIVVNWAFPLFFMSLASFVIIVF